MSVSVYIEGAGSIPGGDRASGQEICDQNGALSVAMILLCDLRVSLEVGCGRHCVWTQMWHSFAHRALPRREIYTL